MGGISVDISEMARKLGLEEEELFPVMELFVETTISDLDRLRAGLQKQNTRTVLEAAHSIKGASGNLGLMVISEVAKGVESKARDESLEGASAAVEMISEEIDRLAGRLKLGW